MFGKLFKKKVNAEAIKFGSINVYLTNFATKRQAMKVLRVLIGKDGEYYTSLPGKEDPFKALLPALGRANPCCSFRSVINGLRYDKVLKSLMKMDFVTVMHTNKPAYSDSLLEKAGKILMKERSVDPHCPQDCSNCDGIGVMHWERKYEDDTQGLYGYHRVCSDCDDETSFEISSEAVEREAIKLANAQAS